MQKKQKKQSTHVADPGGVQVQSEEGTRSSLLNDHFDSVFVQPGSLLFLGGVQHRLCALHGEDIELGGVGAAVGGGRDADFVRVVEHHVVLPQAARAVEDAEHALLHVHVLGRGAPGERVVPLALGAFHERRGAREGDAVFGVGEALLSRDGAGRLADCAVACDV